MSKIKQKIRNFALFLLCLFYFLIRGKAKKTPASIKNVLVFRSKPHIGDMVYITPIFANIKQNIPEAEITLVGSERIGEVVEHNPSIKKFIKYENNFLSTIKRIREQKIDFGCLVNRGSVEGLALLYLSGAKCISVFSSSEYESFMYQILKTFVISKPFQTGVYVPPLYLSLLDPIGANKGDIHFRLYSSENASREIKSIFEKNNISHEKDFLVGISPGGSTKNRWWPKDRYAALINWLSKRCEAKIVFIGNGIDKEAIDKIILGLESTVKYVNFYNQSLDLFKASVSHLDLIIGNDSGPMVTADAFDVPQIVFVGPTDAREYHRPAGLLNRILEASDKKINTISLETAKKELIDLLDKIK